MKLTGLFTLGFLLSALVVKAQLVSTPPTNFISPACAGYGYTFNFTTTGDSRANDGTFRVTVVRASFSGSTVTSSDIVDTGDLCGAYVSGSGTSFTRSAVYYFEPNVVAGDYKFYIFSDKLTDEKSNATNTITAKALPSVVISGGGTMTYSQSLPITFQFTNGEAPFTFEYKDPFDDRWISSSSSSNSVTLPIRFVVSGFYTGSDLIRNIKNGCGTGSSISGSASVTVNPVILTTTALSSANICPGRDALSVTFSGNATPPATSVYAVQLSDVNGNFGSPTVIGTGSSSPIACNIQLMKSLSPGSYKVRVVSTNTSSFVQPSATTQTLVLNRGSLPTVTPLAYCQGGAPSSLLSSIGGSSIFWYNYTVNGGGDIPYNKATPPNAPSDPGTYKYQISQTVNGCESALQYLTVTVNGKSAAPTATPKIVCQNGTVDGTLASGTSLQWFAENGTSALGSTLTLTTNAPGTQTYKVSQDNNGCRSDQTTTTLTVNKLPDPPGVTNPAAICQNGPAQVLTASGSGLKWYDSNNSPLPSAPTPALGNTATQTYYVSSVISNCEGPKSKIEQTFKPASPAPSVSNKVYCRNETAVPLTAGGDNLQWYDAGDNPITDITPKTANIGNTVYKVRQTANGNGCQSASTSLTVIVQDAPGAPSVTPILACLNVPAPPLSPNVTGSPLTWYIASTGGTGTTDAPPISTAALGTQSVFVSQKIGNCEGPRAELKITVNPIPAAPAATDPGPLCQYQAQTASAFTAQGNGLLWYANGQTTGTAQPAITDTSLPTTFTVAVTQTVSTCVSPRKVISQVVNPAPPLPTATPLQLCLNDAAKAISASALAGNTLTWYGTNATGGTPSPTAPVVSASPTRTDTYYFTQTDGTTKCESKRQSVTATIANKPGPPAVGLGLTQFACVGTTPSALSANADNGNLLVWSGTGIASGTTTAAPTPSAATVTTTPFTYSVVQVLGSCVSDPSVISYSIKPLPTAPTLQSPQVACIGQPALGLVATGTSTNTLKWYRGTDTTPSPPTVQTTQSLSETWYVTQTDGNGCQSPKSSPLDVRIRAKATATVSGDDKINAYDSTAIRIQLGGDGPWTMTLWDGTTVNKTLKNPYIKWERPLATRQYSVSVLSNDCGVGTPSNAYTLIVLPALAVEPVSSATLSLVASPNPTVGPLTVEWSALNRQAITLRFLSETGSVIWQADRMGNGHIQTETIQLADRPAGIYFLQLQGDAAGLLVRKLIKQ